MTAGRQRDRQAVGVAARADQRGLAEHQHVDQRGTRDAAMSGCSRNRSGARQTASTFCSAGMSTAGPPPASCGTSGPGTTTVSQRVVAALRGERVGIEAHDAATACRRRAATASACSARPANEPVAQQPSRMTASRLDAAFEQDGKAAGDQLGMVARHRDEPVRRRRRRSPARHERPDRPSRVERSGGSIAAPSQQIVERDDAVRQDRGRSRRRGGSGTSPPRRASRSRRRRSRRCAPR